MDQGRSFKLVAQRESSLVPVFIVPVLFAAWIFLLLVAPPRQPSPSEIPVVIAFLVVFGLALETYVILHRRRVRSARLMIDGDGVSFHECSKKRWQVAWSDLESVVLRKYTLRYSYFHEALVFSELNGSIKTVPTASMLYGNMRDFNDLSELMCDRGHSIRTDHKPQWLVPG